MKQLFFTLLAACTVLATNAQKVINDPNVEVRSVGSFTKVDVSSSFHVIITQGNQESVAVSSNIEGDNQHITTTVENGRLKIGYKNNNRKWYKNQNLRAYVSVKNIEAIGGSGASKITYMAIWCTLVPWLIGIELLGR